jgi:PAS domain S-box-containing protein
MSDDLCLLVCDNHSEEVSRVLSEAGLGEVRLEVFPSRCGRPSLDWKKLLVTLQDHNCPPDHTIVLANGCLNAQDAPPPELDGCRIPSYTHTTATDCNAWFAPPATINEHQRGGGYLMTTGWLQRWESTLELWGFDRATAGEFFRECSRRLVLLDTEILPDHVCEPLLAEMSEYLGMPHQVVPVGLDRFRAFLQQQIYEWRLTQQRLEIATANRRVADYATVADLGTQLAHAQHEEEAVDLVFGFLEIFCAPQRLAYLPLVNGDPGELRLQNRLDGDREAMAARMASIDTDFAWTPSGAGFTIRVPDGPRTVGVLEADDLALPRRREEYLDLTLGLVTSFGMAVVNSRAQQKAQRFSNVLSRSLNEIYMFDAETLRFIDVNRGARANLGYTLAELRELTPVDIKPNFSAESFAQAVEPLRSGAQEMIRFDTTHRRKDSTEYPVQVNLELIGGDVPTYIAVILDLTDAQAAQRDREELAEQLRQAQKMEAVGRLAGGVAHDFNNMLTIILGTCDLMHDELPSGSPQRTDVEQIQEAGVRAQSLTQQLLAFSRRQTLRPEVLDLSDLVRELHRMLRRMIAEDVELVTLPGDDLWSVKADAGQIGQVVMNLAINARDAMPDGGKLTIETRNVDLDEAYVKSHLEATGGPHVMIAVSDTGRGMDAETQAQIFEPFFTTKGVGEGTGLGLATVHGIVLQSGGNIRVYSEPGEGTTFKIYLPRADCQRSALLTPRRLDDASLHGSETVLIVEDELAVLKLTIRILSRLGYKVLRASNGGDAELVAHQYSGRIHLLLTDVIMPGQSGRITAERLLESRPNLEVLFMSGYTDNAIAHHGVLDLGTNFLEKPFSPMTLASTVRAVLDKLATSNGS